MKSIIATGILGCLLLSAAAAGAGPVTKFVFENAFVDGVTPVTIRAGTKQVKKTGYTVCEYFVYPTDQYLGAWEDNVFVEDGLVRQYCVDKYASRT